MDSWKFGYYLANSNANFWPSVHNLSTLGSPKAGKIIVEIDEMRETMRKVPYFNFSQVLSGPAADW